VHVSGARGAGAALELGVGEERLFVGVGTSTLGQGTRFAVEFPRDCKSKVGDFYSKLPQVFFASDPSAPDRATGSRYAAVCARGDTGTFSACAVDSTKEGKVAELPKSAFIMIAGIERLPPVPGRPHSVALLPHFALQGLDGAQRTHFIEHVQKSAAGCLAQALFLFEFSATVRALAWATPRDQLFQLDLLIEAFLGDEDSGGALGASASEAVSANLKRWKKERHPLVGAGTGLPLYKKYASLPEADIIQLGLHRDAAISLLWATSLVAAQGLSGAAAGWSGFEFLDAPVPKLGSVEDSLDDLDNDDKGGEPNIDMCKILTAHLNDPGRESSEASVGRALTEPAMTNDVPTLIKHCVGDSARHSNFRRAALASLKETLSNGAAKKALQHFCEWLPLEMHEFQRPGNEDGSPGVRFRAFSAGLFANVDGGKVTNPEKLLESMGERSPPYQVMSTNSKSGEFFCFSHDKFFLIKTVTDAEARLLHSMLPAYQDHLRTYPKSVIVRYAGLFHMKVEGARGLSKFFTIMVSSFDPTCKIHETFDVKGSLYHRKKKENESIGKDQDWYDAGRRLQLPDHVWRELLAVHEADAAFLMRFNVLDYSLLIGVHHLSPDEPRGAGYRDGGGLWAQGAKEIYFIGLIDFLIGFTLKKQAEHLVRAAQGHAEDASCVSPETYAFRQVKFLRDSVFETGGSSHGTLGTLRITQMAGHDLVNKDGPFDLSDPYIVATIGLQRSRTPTVRNNLNPKWSCEIVLPINDCHRDMQLTLSMMDEDSVAALRGSDDAMGSVEISVSEILSSSPFQIKELQLQGVSKGRLSCHIVFEPVAAA